MYRQDGFRELDRQECFRLLAQVPVGRIVYTQNALPAVLPLNFSLDHDFSVLLRTAATSRIAYAVDGAVVAFEADWFDESGRTGWSVIVTGPAALVTDPGEYDRLRCVGPNAWVPTPEDVFIRIPSELVAGHAVETPGHGDPRNAPSAADAR